MVEVNVLYIRVYSCVTQIRTVVVVVTVSDAKQRLRATTQPTSLTLSHSSSSD